MPLVVCIPDWPHTFITCSAHAEVGASCSMCSRLAGVNGIWLGLAKVDAVCRAKPAYTAYGTWVNSKALGHLWGPSYRALCADSSSWAISFDTLAAYYAILYFPCHSKVVSVEYNISCGSEQCLRLSQPYVSHNTMGMVQSVIFLALCSIFFPGHIHITVATWPDQEGLNHAPPTHPQHMPVPYSVENSQRGMPLDVLRPLSGVPKSSCWRWPRKVFGARPQEWMGRAC